MPRPDPRESARAAGLRYVDDDAPGITRRRRGRGFSYHRADGSLITDEDELERIRAVAVPPAWTDVWISPRADTHIQATGRDDRGRKQYRYHAAFRRARDGAKYERLAEFGEALTPIRERVRRDLRREGAPRRKVVAAVVRLLDRTLARVGNHEYAERNDTYGLTTLRNDHVAVRGSRLHLRYPGKGDQELDLVLDDERLAGIVRRCRAFPGDDLFQYVDDGGGAHKIGSGDVNDYVRDAAGGDFTAKDYRTWGATVLAVERLCAGQAPSNGEALKEAVEYVAEQLANTPTVSRDAYLHPGVLEMHDEQGLDRIPPSRAKRYRELRVAERRLMTVLGRLSRGHH